MRRVSLFFSVITFSSVVLGQVTFESSQDDFATEYDIPNPRIVAFTPKGLRIILQHAEGIDLVGLIANINIKLSATASTGMIKKDITRPVNNRWVYNDPDRILNVNDIIYYKLAVRRWGRTYFSGLRLFRIKALVTAQGALTEGIIWPGSELASYPPSTSKPVVRPPARPPSGVNRPPPRPPASAARPPVASPVVNKPCQVSKTIVRGKPACKGELIFEEHFDALNLTTWQYNVRIADTPDYEFCIYDKREQNAFIRDGVLNIKPSLTDKVYGVPFMTTGYLNLEDCTATNTDECSQQANFGFIMPAVMSSRLRSAPFFSFKFGRVEVKAKMAAGDWLTSSILLQPLKHSYGPRYDSGQIRLAMARGNRDLQCDDVESGISQVEAGVMLTAGEDALRRDMGSRELVKGWDKEFHIYRVDWTPEKMTFYMDNKVVTTITPPEEGGFHSHVEFEDSDAPNPWRSGSKMAPFDKEFFLAISLGAGGIHDFPDTCVNNGQQKPWKNGQPKAKLNFYKKQNEWAPTWKSPLQIDYIKVWAL